MAYIIAPLDKVKVDYSEFMAVMRQVERVAIARAVEIWPGFSLGGLIPGDKEFGIGNILPKDVLGAGIYSWTQSFASPGSWTNIFSYSVPEDEIHAFAGFAISDPTLIFNQIRLEISDKKYPIWEIEEANLYEKAFAIIIKADPGDELVAQQETSVLLKGYQERGTKGYEQRVIPIGINVYKRKDLVIKE
ncbi:MAG: hypothetical protein QMC85_06960 [Methanocellales archaeon]|nr:hypothetical protein [Methanocellales archaeon]